MAFNEGNFLRLRSHTISVTRVKPNKPSGLVLTRTRTRQWLVFVEYTILL